MCVTQRYDKDCDASAKGSDAAKVAELTTSAAIQASAEPVEDPKRHDFVVAPFTEGTGEVGFFRARIEELDRAPDAADGAGIDAAVAKNRTAEVLFIDHGNRARVRVSKLRQCAPELLLIAPLAHQCRLAFVRAPSVGEEWGNEAGNMLADLTWGLPVLAKVHWQEGDGTLVASVFAGEDELAAVAAQDEAKKGAPRSASFSLHSSLTHCWKLSR